MYCAHIRDDDAILANLRQYTPNMGLSLKSDAGRVDFIRLYPIYWTYYVIFSPKG